MVITHGDRNSERLGGIEPGYTHVMKQTLIIKGYPGDDPGDRTIGHQGWSLEPGNKNIICSSAGFTGYDMYNIFGTDSEMDFR